MSRDAVGEGVGVLADTARDLVLLALAFGGIWYLSRRVRGNPNKRKSQKSDDSWLAAGLLLLPP